MASSRVNMASSVAAFDSDTNPCKGLDCNICLELVEEPVVTLCGHLYCWPCIYKWLHFQPSTKSSDQNQAQQDHHQQQCPVCKSEVSPATLVPLYGRGKTTKLSEDKARHLGRVIPRRPSSLSCSIGALLATTRTSTSTSSTHLRRDYLYQSPQPYHPHHLSGYEPPTMESSSQPFSPMSSARLFGSSVTNPSWGRNSYHLAGSGSPRLRRHLVQADVCMDRICFFLCCCVIACLLLF